MAISLDHTIVWATDQCASARFLADTLGLSVGPHTGPFLPLPLDNGVTLDYAEATSVTPQHYAFTVDDHTFTTALAHLVAAGIPFYADPFQQHPGRTNSLDGRRGLYFADPDGHNLELLTLQGVNG